MDLYEAMHTTFAAREYTDDPIDDATVHRILDHARFAPNGGNRQGWKVVVVRERATREALRDLVTPVARRYVAQVKAGENPWNTIVPCGVDDATIAATEPLPHLLSPILKAPVLLLLGVDLNVVASMDQYADRVGMTSGASVYPFAWNILLAARAEGFGGVITTFVTAVEADVQRLLGMPSHVAVAALLPIGRPVKQLTRLRRNPVESFAVRERWDGEPLRAG